MDTRRFTDDKPGSFVRTSVGGRDDSAFVPEPLPPKWEFPAHLWPLLSDSKGALRELNGIGRTLPNPQLLLKPLQEREALRSSSLEGTYASPEELLLFQLQPREPRSEMDRANAWLEVSNYSKALREGWAYLNDERPLSLSFVCQLHRWLLESVRGRDKTPGVFRDRQVQIGADARFLPPPLTSLRPCLEAFEQRMQTAADRRFDPLVRCYLLHYQFEAIHPFRDGNGRVGRLLLALMTYRWCDLSMPWLYMSAFFERYRNEYINRLFDVSARGDWEAWIEFCLIGTLEQARDSIARCDQLRSLMDEFHATASTGTSRLQRVVNGLFTFPIVTIPQLARDHNVTYPTAKSDIHWLVDLNILQELHESKPKTFYCPAIFAIAYRDVTDVTGDQVL